MDKSLRKRTTILLATTIGVALQFGYAFAAISEYGEIGWHPTYGVIMGSMSLSTDPEEDVEDYSKISAELLEGTGPAFSDDGSLAVATLPGEDFALSWTYDPPWHCSNGWYDAYGRHRKLVNGGSWTAYTYKYKTAYVAICE